MTPDRLEESVHEILMLHRSGPENLWLKSEIEMRLPLGEEQAQRLSQGMQT